MTACTGCGTELTFTETDGWTDATGRPFCGPGERNWHLPAISREEIEAEAREFVEGLRETATARGRFYDGTR